MKKILQLLTVAILSFSVGEINAQVTTGSLSPDWTLTDINGVSHNLYTYLNAGKTVIIDISATWCGPCWSYHNSGALEDTWVNHGPAGGLGVSSTTTDDCMVFYVEGDASTGIADLNGTTSGSQGNWVSGTKYPIINPTSSTNPSVNTFNNMYNIAGFPACIMICSNKSMKEVDQYTAAQLYAAKTSTCPASVSAGSDAKMILSTTLNSGLATCDSVTPSFLLGNNGTTILTSATITYKVDGVVQKVKSWTGSIASNANTTVTGVKLGASATGSHTISVTVSNPNGGSDPTAANNTTTAAFVKYTAIGGVAVAESFESAGIPAAWPITNGGSGLTWTDTTIGFSSSKSAKLNWFNIVEGDIDMLGLPSMSFAGAVSPALTFDVAYCGYTSSTPENDKLEVEISTNCGTTWVSIYNKAGNSLKTKAPQTGEFTPSSSAEWRHESVSLNTYAGQSGVLLRFKGTSDYGNNLYLDNVNVTGLNTTTNISSNEIGNSIKVYPNPMMNNADIEFQIATAASVTIAMYNMLGETVFSNALGEMNSGIHTIKLDARNLNAGIYYIALNANNNKIIKKVIINK
ncbi:MAG: T9SS type A sorting domain-containing protein [Bacteroidota bacterium]